MNVLKFFISTLMIFISINSFAQEAQSTVYRNLKTKKFYSVNTKASTKNGKTTYKVNNKVVKKSTYKKYHRTWKNMENCCPCILKSYDEKKVLLSEAVSCTDCLVGYYKGYYRNGTIKVIGHYKENPTGDWTNIYQRGYCSVKDGKWTYFNKKGKIKYIEIWDNGKFVEQQPSSKKVEIWEVDLMLNGIAVDTQRVTLEEFNQLEVVPRYKNANESTTLMLKLGISAVGFKYIAREIKMRELKDEVINDMLKEAGITDLRKVNAQIGVYDKGKNIWNFSIGLANK